MKHSSRVRSPQCFVYERIVSGKLSQIEWLAVMFRYKLQTLLQNGHHPEPQQIHLHNSHVRAIVFVPLDDNTAGHGGWFQGNNRIQLVLTNNHPAGMLAEVTRQILNSLTQLVIFPYARMEEVETRLLKVIF